MERFLSKCVVGALITLFFSASAAMAGYPLSVAGKWQLRGSAFVASLVLSQSSLAASACKPIQGTISVPGEEVSGYYCPTMGRIVFFGSTTRRIYAANLASGGEIIDFMGGAYIVWSVSGGRMPNEGVDFPFSAIRSNGAPSSPSY